MQCKHTHTRTLSFIQVNVYPFKCGSNTIQQWHSNANALCRAYLAHFNEERKQNESTEKGSCEPSNR